MAKQEPSGEVVREEEPDQSDADLQMVSEDLMHAIQTKDSRAMVSALRAAFQVLQMGER